MAQAASLQRRHEQLPDTATSQCSVAVDSFAAHKSASQCENVCPPRATPAAQVPGENIPPAPQKKISTDPAQLKTLESEWRWRMRRARADVLR